ncbi:glutathione-disulfide reductase [Undibacterium sp. CY18W]|uniref:Glutathione-disulfide reductase n=1 Tax=Undibacterium hunanense TaxID=2762292 RepID=A0ABR6ZP48_9BURK|nr:glutathione-disulfide reductase [Undibacterium hunanense]MBC3917623.1 glutathione-disulfide reductase [Undibacterium hunanense]
MHTYDYDLFTIGGGSGGVRASRFAAQYGARVALAEAGPLGGTCVNVGCIPKKLMSYAAHYHADFEEAAGFGWSLTGQRFDWPTLIANKDKEIARLNGIYSQLLTNAKVHIIAGHAQILDAHTVVVNGQSYRAHHILIATGGHPVRPELPGSELGITSDEFFHLPALPRHAVVQGGGYIAVELASILNGLGCKVTLVQRGAQILRTMDSDLGHFLINEMRKKGIEIALDTKILSITASGDSKRVALSDGRTLDSDCVLFATGRQPNVKGLGLEHAGVQVRENGAIIVNEHFATSVDNIYAIGDVIDRVALTPVALAEGMIVAANLFQHGRKLMSYENIPTAVFSHPNVATLGLTEAKAREKHPHVKIFKSEFKALKHTMSGSTERCLMKMIVDADTDRVLGMHMVGADAGEIIQGFAVAMQCGVTKAQVDATIGVHPTIAEEFVTMRTAVV